MMKLAQKKQKRIIIFLTILSIGLTFVFATLSFIPGTENKIAEFVQNNSILSRILLVVLNASSIIILPFSMSLTNIIAIKFINWYEVALYSLLGNYIGYIYAFTLSKKFNNYFQKLFKSLNQLNKFENSLNGKERIGGLTIFRIATQGFSDYTSYFLGLTSVSWQAFIVSMVIAEIVIKVPRYYLAYLGYNVNPIYFSGILILIIAGYYLYKSKYKDD